MSHRRSDDDDPRLDALLESWAQASRLDADQADAMLRDVLRQPRTVLHEPPASLPATWWSDFSAQVSAAVVLANSRPGTFPELAPRTPAAA